jgi:hypothetical protein
MTDPEFAAAITAAFQAFNERRFADFATYVRFTSTDRLDQPELDMLRFYRLMP